MNQNLTEIVFILDCSGFMGNLEPLSGDNNTLFSIINYLQR
jgi:hypothetical protein